MCTSGSIAGIINVDLKDNCLEQNSYLLIIIREREGEGLLKNTPREKYMELTQIDIKLS